MSDDLMPSRVDDVLTSIGTFMNAKTAIHVSGRLIRIAYPEGDKYDSLPDPASTVYEIRGSSSRVDLFTFMEILPHTVPRHAYHVERDNLAVLPITTFEHWIANQIRFKVRNKVRKAEKNGVRVREVSFNEELVEGIAAIYNETPIRQGRLFPHYGKPIDAVRTMTATFLDRSIFLGAFLGDELIGFAKLVPDRALVQAGLMHIVSMIRHRDKAPTNALIAHAVRACATRNIPNLVYSNFAYGNKQHDSLSEFKAHNGFQRTDVPRYYVPITPLGHLALRLKLHLGLTSHLPEALLAQARRARNRWYSSRPSMAVSD
jgi:hypothetical protein